MHFFINSVPDARTPVLRLLLRNVKRTPCELSVQNLLSECKANLVRDIVRAETTGTINSNFLNLFII